MEIKNQYQTKLIELAERYINEYLSQEKQLEKAKVNKELYEDLLMILNDTPINVRENKLSISLLLDAIYNDDIYLKRFYDTLVNLGNTKEAYQEYRELVDRIEKDYEENEKRITELDNKLKRTRRLFLTAKRAKRCLSQGIAITQYKYDITNIKTIIDYYATSGIISNQEALFLINEIETYNRRLYSIKNNNEEEIKYAEYLYNKAINIFKTTYELPDQVEVLEKRRPTLDKFVKEILDYIEYIDDADIVEIIEKYQKYDIDDNEYNYIVNRIIEYYLDKLLELTELLSDREIFLNYKDRLELIEKYYQKLDTYLLIRKYYEKINEPPEEDQSKTEEIIREIESVPTRRLIYATAPTNILKPRIISDMDDIPREYYGKVKYLLDTFKKGIRDSAIAKPLKGRTNKISFELMDDQIRIVLKQVKDDIYIVCGVFTKKANNDDKTYKKLKNRAIPLFDTEEEIEQYLELAKSVEDDIEELVKTKGRKGTR